MKVLKTGTKTTNPKPSIGMFQDTPDANVWHFIAYAAGTGGSMLIIGSAAGVVAMGMEKITFFWYLKI